VGAELAALLELKVHTVSTMLLLLLCALSLSRCEASQVCMKLGVLA